MTPLILTEIKLFINEQDLELLAMALKTANIVSKHASAAQLGDSVRECFGLANSTTVQGRALEELHSFFEVACLRGAIHDEIIQGLISKSTKKNIINASCAAHSILKLPAAKQQDYLSKFVALIKTDNVDNKI
jgi:site-specific recombinase XerD